jgi:hypothetical protein
MVYICFADPEAIATGLNPLTISHALLNINCIIQKYKEIINKLRMKVLYCQS